MTSFRIALICALVTLGAFAAGDEGTPATFAAEFAQRWTITRKLAVGVAEAMPSPQYAFKPDPGSMSFGELMSHIARANYAFCAGLKDTAAPAMPTAVTKEDLVKFMGDSFDYCVPIISTRTGEHLDKIHPSPDGRLNGRELLLALYVHLAHHRGQAEVYLRDKGIKPPPYVF